MTGAGSRNATCACGDADCPLGGRSGVTPPRFPETGALEQDEEAFGRRFHADGTPASVASPDRWAKHYQPNPSVKSYGWHNPDQSRMVVLPSPAEQLQVVSTWPAVPTTDLVVLGPDAARKIATVLGELVEEAYACETGAPTTAEIIRESVDELRALLGLPRKT